MIGPHDSGARLRSPALGSGVPPAPDQQALLLNKKHASLHTVNPPVQDWGQPQKVRTAGGAAAPLLVRVGKTEQRGLVLGQALLSHRCQGTHGGWGGLLVTSGQSLLGATTWQRALSWVGSP